MLPIGTDAPLYHYPITTVGLIIANVVCFAATGFGNPELTDPWVLHFGTLNPLEWLSSMFAHAGIGHIVGNMFFLLGFGLIVEGKIGWYRMLALYMGIGLTQAAFIQVIMLPWKVSGALGASSAIMGLMTISMVWAPKNELKTLLFIGFRVFVFDITIMWFACYYLFWDLLSFILIHGGGMGTPALHLSGAMIGFGAGVLFLKKGWVDCENWDLFRVLKGTYGPYADPSTTVGSHADPTLMFGHSDVAVKNELPDESRGAKISKRLKRINEMIDASDFIGASEAIFDLRLQDDSSLLTQARLKRLSSGLLTANMPDDAEIYLEEYVERFPEEAAWARVRIAQLLLNHHKRPSAALAALKKVRLSQLSANLQQLGRKIAAAAKKQVKAGVQDAEPEW
ncbi:MAG: rhomboid family intramembrane serine protease [Fuerstiella sp.]